MLDEQIEERLDGVEKKLEELSARVEELRQEREEALPLIPEAEYDFVPSVPDKVIGRFKVRLRNVVKADSLLCLTDEEWRIYSTPDET